MAADCFGMLKALLSTSNGFLADPGIEVSNNRAENAIHPFVVGRKNWLFSDSPKGASAGAMLYSLVVSAKMNTILRGLFQASFFFGLLREFIGRLPKCRYRSGNVKISAVGDRALRII